MNYKQQLDLRVQMSVDTASKHLSDTSHLLTIYFIGLHLQSEVITLNDKAESLFQLFVCVGDFPIGLVNHFGPLVFPSSVVKG